MDKNKELLVNYIKDQLASGVQETLLQSVVKAQGWTDQDYNEAVIVAKSQILNNITNINLPINNQNVQPVASASLGGIRKVVSIVAVVIILLVLAGGGVWGYFNYISPDPQKTINKSITNLVNRIEQKGLLSAVGNFSLKGSGNIPQNPSGVSSVDFSVEIDSQADLNANKTFGGLSFSLDIDAGKILKASVDGKNFLDVVSSNNKLFLKINKIPSGLESYTSQFLKPNELVFINNEVIGKWIEFDQDQMATLSKMGAFPVSFSYSSQSFDLDKAKKIMKVFANSNIFIIDEVLSSDTVNNQNVFHYRVKVDKNRLTDFLIVASKEANNGQYPEGVSEQNLRDGVDQLFSQYDQMKNSGASLSFDVYIGRFSKLPVKFGLNIDAGNIPQIKQAGVVSLTAEMSATYDFPPSINIVEPTSFITVIEMLAKIGTTFPSSKQTNTINNSSQSVNTASKIYIDNVNGFSITPPSAWVKDYNRGTLISFTSSTGVIDVQSYFNSYDLNSGLDDYIKRFSDSYPDFKLIDKKKITVSGKNAYLVSGTFSFDSIKFRLTTAILRGDKFYEVSAQSTDLTWTRDQNLINSSLMSFKLN